MTVFDKLASWDNPYIGLLACCVKVPIRKKAKWVPLKLTPGLHEEYKVITHYVEMEESVTSLKDL